jgi:hypothetical protein
MNLIPFLSEKDIKIERVNHLCSFWLEINILDYDSIMIKKLDPSI